MSTRSAPPHPIELYPPETRGRRGGPAFDFSPKRVSEPGAHANLQSYAQPVLFLGTLAFFLVIAAFPAAGMPTINVTNPPPGGPLITSQVVVAINATVSPANSTVLFNDTPVSTDAFGNVGLQLTLYEGNFTLYLNATDWLNETAHAVIEVVVDLTPPPLSVATPANGSLINVVSVDVTGQTEPGANVTVNGKGAAVDGVGNFVLPNVSLEAIFSVTENQLVIRATDASGNIAYANTTVFVDIVAPSIELNLPPDIASKVETGQPLSRTSIIVGGSTDDSAAVIMIAGQEAPLSGFAFASTFALREGPNEINITAQDPAGNVRILVLVVVRDTIAPPLSLTVPPPSVLTNQSTLKIDGNTGTESSVVVYVNFDDIRGIPAMVPLATSPNSSSGAFEFSYTLDLNSDDNVHRVELRAVDSAGNAVTVGFAYTCDLNPPALDILGFKHIVFENWEWINGSTDPDVSRVEINGESYDVMGQYFAIRVDLPTADQNYTFTVIIRDAAGNTNRWVSTVWRRTPPTPLPESPTLAVNGTNATSVTAGTSTTFSLNITNTTGLTISWSLDGSLAGAGPSINLTLSEGNHTLTANVSNGDEHRDYSFAVIANAVAAAPPPPTAPPTAGTAWIVIVGAAAAAGAAGVLMARRRNK
jgi:hypothetical protein